MIHRHRGPYGQGGWNKDTKKPFGDRPGRLPLVPHDVREMWARIIAKEEKMFATRLTSRRDTLKAQREWAAAVRKRDGPWCRFERFFAGDWHECGRPAYDTCHIFPRRHLNPKVRYHPDVGIRGCRTCHTQFDADHTNVGIEIKRWNRAVRRANSSNKISVPGVRSK